MKKVIWYSQHQPIPAQIAELKRLFGDIAIDHQGKAFDDVNNIIKYFRNSKAIEIVIVAPLSVILKICEAGIRPLWSDMAEVPPDGADIVIQKRRQGRPIEIGYNFKGFKRVKRLALEFEEI